MGFGSCGVRTRSSTPDPSQPASLVPFEGHRHDDRGGVVGPLDELDLADGFGPLGADGEVAELLPPEAEGELGLGDVDRPDVIGEVDAVLQGVVFGPCRRRSGGGRSCGSVLRASGSSAPQPLIPLRKWIALAGPLQGMVDGFGHLGRQLAVRAVEHDRVGRPCRPAGRPGGTGRPSKVLGDQSGKISRSIGDSGAKNIPRVVIAVATAWRSSGRYLPRLVRKARRSAIPSGPSCFSNPSGMSDRFEAANSSISSRRTRNDFPSASSSSTADFDSEASRPLRTRPSFVARVYWTKFPSTLRLGSRMWISSSSRGWVAHPGQVGADLAPLAAVAVALGALLGEGELALGRVAPLEATGAS